jgi:putative dimethyl sulfoxide reductase chaperone
VWVKDFIEDAGCSYRTDYNDLPDHISIELEFMRELTAREAQALDGGDAGKARELRRLQEKFLTRYMARWVPEFCGRVAAATEQQFFSSMAALTKDFIRSEVTALTSR